MKNIKEIVGLKGLGATMVILIHYTATFFPAMWTGDFSYSHIEIIEKNVHNIPFLYFFINGSFAVYIFWVVSAFLIAYSWYTKHDYKDLTRKSLNKYFRIWGIVFISIVMAACLMRFGLMKNIEVSECSNSTMWLALFYTLSPSVKSVLSDFVYNVFFNSTSYNPALWTIKIEFLGSLLTSLLLILFGDLKKRYFLWILISMFLIFFSPQYLCFVLGTIIADIYVKDIHIHSILLWILLFLGIIVGGDIIKSLFPSVNNTNIYTFFQCLAASFIVFPCLVDFSEYSNAIVHCFC